MPDTPRLSSDTAHAIIHAPTRSPGCGKIEPTNESAFLTAYNQGDQSTDARTWTDFMQVECYRNH
ncbi:hypothetical protein [Granulicella sp. L46]|uniref:hypothetical protein n=1 Tax=Granulicella sp. L46 TaxID=1641865 RepID=UPI00131BF919|nr:hypothetical protein [Granulicella sp. L46]